MPALMPDGGIGIVKLSTKLKVASHRVIFKDYKPVDRVFRFYREAVIRKALSAFCASPFISNRGAGKDKYKLKV